MGRKSKLNKEIISEAAKLIKAGNYHQTVAQYIGVDISTWFRWLQKGERHENELYYEFYKAIKKAEAEAHARNVAVIQKAATDNWQAAAWWLERKYPELWAKKDRHEFDKENNEIVIKIERVESERSKQEENADG